MGFMMMGSCLMCVFMHLGWAQLYRTRVDETRNCSYFTLTVCVAAAQTDWPQTTVIGGDW